MRLQRKRHIAWSGPNGDAPGPSFSGHEAMQAGLLPIHDFAKWLKKQPRTKGWPGRITQERIRGCVSEDEMHHWRYSNGRVKLIEFYRPDKALEEMAEIVEGGFG